MIMAKIEENKHKNVTEKNVKALNDPLAKKKNQLEHDTAATMEV